VAIGRQGRSNRPAVSTLERVWFTWLAVTAVIALAFDGGGMASHRP
jgi:hypothetical protein